MPAPASAQRIRETIEPVVTAAGLWLEEVELARDGGQQVVRVVLDALEDAEDSVDMDAVAEVSRAVSAALDDTDGLPERYTLEVSSRGASAPLTARRHYSRAIGRLVDLRLVDGGTLAGRLVEVERDEDALVVVPVTPGVKGRPAKIGDPVRLPLTQVRDGHVEVELGKDSTASTASNDSTAGNDAEDIEDTADAETQTNGPTGRED